MAQLLVLVAQRLEVAAGRLAFASGIALLVGDVEVFACAADGDVEEAVFFVELAVFDAAPGGELAFDSFDDEYGVEFEAFRLMHGEDADAIFVAELALKVEAQGSYFEGFIECGHVRDDTAEFVEIRQAFFAIGLAAEVLFKEAFVKDHVERFDWRLGAGALAPVFELSGEFDEAFADLRDRLASCLLVSIEEELELFEDVGGHTNVVHGAMGFALRKLEGFDDA